MFYKIILFGLILFVVGCGKSSPKNIEYVRDEKHNICFATGYFRSKGFVTSVPCNDEVMKEIRGY